MSETQLMSTNVLLYNGAIPEIAKAMNSGISPKMLALHEDAEKRIPDSPNNKARIALQALRLKISGQEDDLKTMDSRQARKVIRQDIADIRRCCGLPLLLLTQKTR